MVVLQEVLLNQVRREQISVDVHLVNGEIVNGLVKGFDSFTIIVEQNKKQNLIYKHAIASIIPNEFVQLSQKKIQ